MNESSKATPPASVAGLDPDVARRLLDAAEDVRRAARADQQGLAIPLLVLGPLTVGAAVLQLVWEWVTFRDLGPGEGRDATAPELMFSLFVEKYWGTVGALGLVVMGIWFGWRSRRRGVGSGAGAWIAGAVGVFVLVAYNGLMLWVWHPLAMVTILAPSSVIALALLLIAWRRHNGRLALWVFAFGLVTVLAGLYFFTNRAYDLLHLLGRDQETVLALGGTGDAAAQVLLGILLTIVGWRALRSAGNPRPVGAVVR